MGKLFDAMSKFESITENNEKKPNSNIPARKIDKVIEKQNIDTKKLKENELERHSKVEKKKHDDNIPASSKNIELGKQVNNEIIDKAKQAEPQYIVLNQVMQKETDKATRQVLDED